MVIIKVTNDVGVVGNLCRFNMITWVVAPTKPAIKAAPNSVCPLKYGCKYIMKSAWKREGRLL